MFGLNILYFKDEKGLGKATLLHEPYPKIYLMYLITRLVRFTKMYLMPSGVACNEMSNIPPLLIVFAKRMRFCTIAPSLLAY